KTRPIFAPASPRLALVISGSGRCWSSAMLPAVTMRREVYSSAGRSRDIIKAPAAALHRQRSAHGRKFAAQAPPSRPLSASPGWAVRLLRGLAIRSRRYCLHQSNRGCPCIPALPGHPDDKDQSDTPDAPETRRLPPVYKSGFLPPRCGRTRAGCPASAWFFPHRDHHPETGSSPRVSGSDAAPTVPPGPPCLFHYQSPRFYCSIYSCVSQPHPHLLLVAEQLTQIRNQVCSQQAALPDFIRREIGSGGMQTGAQPGSLADRQPLSNQATQHTAEHIAHSAGGHAGITRCHHTDSTVLSCHETARPFEDHGSAVTLLKSSNRGKTILLYLCCLYGQQSPGLSRMRRQHPVITTGIGGDYPAGSDDVQRIGIQ